MKQFTCVSRGAALRLTAVQEEGKGGKCRGKKVEVEVEEEEEEAAGTASKSN